MGDNDCISRSALYERAAEWEAQAFHMVEKHMNDVDATEWRKWLTILAERSAFKFDVAVAPAIEQPMSAVEFGEKWRRLCKSFSQSPCSTCPLYAFGDTCSLPTTQSIAIVDAWTKEHPEEREEKDNE